MSVLSMWRCRTCGTTRLAKTEDVPFIGCRCSVELRNWHPTPAPVPLVRPSGLTVRHQPLLPPLPMPSAVAGTLCSCGERWPCPVLGLLDRVRELEAAIRDHRTQKADDRCIEDDDRLYAALGDGITCDRRVGSKAEMLANCARFIERRCEGGGWRTYRELEEENARLRSDLKRATTCRCTIPNDDGTGICVRCVQSIPVEPGA